MTHDIFGTDEEWDKLFITRKQWAVIYLKIALFILVPLLGLGAALAWFIS